MCSTALHCIDCTHTVVSRDTRHLSITTPHHACCFSFACTLCTCRFMASNVHAAHGTHLPACHSLPWHLHCQAAAQAVAQVAQASTEAAQARKQQCCSSHACKARTAGMMSTTCCAGASAHMEHSTVWMLVAPRRWRLLLRCLPTMGELLVVCWMKEVAVCSGNKSKWRSAPWMNCSCTVVEYLGCCYF